MGLEQPGMECTNSSCLTLTSLGLRAACPSHLTRTVINVLWGPASQPLKPYGAE